MGLFKKSAAQREAEEAEQKRLEEEEYQRKVKEKQEEQARIAEATRKQMEAAKAKRESQAPKKAIAEGATASTKVHRSGGLGTGEAATINEQVRLKMEEARKRKEAEAKRKDEERRKREEEMRARGEEVNDLPTAGAMKWGIAASKLGSASLKMKALQEEQAMKGVWKRPDQGDADDGDVPQQPQAKAADPTENGIGRPLPKPTKTISIADKNAARSAAALAGGLFLTYDEKVTLDERVNKMHKKLADVEAKLKKAEQVKEGGGGGGVASAVASRVRRMSLTRGSSAPKPSEGASSSGMSSGEVDEAARNFSQAFGGGGDDLLANATDHMDGGSAATAGEPAKPKGGRRRSITQRMGDAIGLTKASQPTELEA